MTWAPWRSNLVKQHMLSSRPELHNRTNARPGFTLVELLVVIAVILILSGIVFGLSGGIADKQARGKAETELQSIAVALETYKMKYGDYPWLGPDGDGNKTDLYKHLTGQLKMVPTSTAGSPDINASGDGKPILDPEKMTVSGTNDGSYFMDPWGQSYRYYYKSSGSSTWNYPGYILLSVGKDGKIDDDGLSKGEISADHFAEEDNVDNIVQGFEL